MKKQIYIFFIMIFGLFVLSGCGKTTERTDDTLNGTIATKSYDNEEKPTTENEKVVGDYPPCVMIDNTIYQDTGYASSMIGCGNMDGEIKSTVDGKQLPSENDQSNCGTGYQYQRCDENYVLVMIDDEKRIFRNIDYKDSSIPKQVMNFTAKVEEIMENGTLTVSYISVADGFASMSEGEYEVSADNLQEEVQVGNIVTIWFNGNVMETYPAQIGVVYRIEKSE